MRRSTAGVTATLALFAAAALFLQWSKLQGDDKPKTPTATPATTSDPAVARARREVQMLDDLYKTSIVLITTHYVDDDKSLPAGSAFQALFSTMKEKGWHEVRLLDATGEPVNSDNSPREGFEQRAIAELLAGKTTVDEVIVDGGKRYLLAATSIPVVMDKCVMCHDNFRDRPNGQAIGALGYRIPVLD